MDEKKTADSPAPFSEPRRMVFTASPNAYVTYAQIVELMDGLPLDKQQAICRYLADHVAKKVHGQQPNAPVFNRKKVKSNEHER